MVRHVASDEYFHKTEYKGNCKPVKNSVETQTRKTRRKRKMMNTMTLETLYANTTDLENEQYSPEERKEIARDRATEKGELIKEYATRKGIFEEVKADLYFAVRDCDMDALNELSDTVFRYKEPSQKQIDLAGKLCEELGVPAPAVTLEHDVAWFSRLIDVGIQKSRMLPPTEGQENILANMAYCPDIPKYNGTTRGEASDHIGEYKNVYSSWAVTRATKSTIEMLMAISKKANLSKEECSYAYCHQYTEREALEEIKRIEEKARKAEEQKLSSADGYFDMFNENGLRQSFHNKDNEKRRKAEKASGK